MLKNPKSMFCILEMFNSTYSIISLSQMKQFIINIKRITKTHKDFEQLQENPDVICDN